MAPFEVGLLIASVAVFGATVLPRLLVDKPLSFPIVYVGFGFAVFSLPLGVTPPDPVAQPRLTEQLTALVVIVSLMGAGLKLDRPFDLRGWATTWRLLVVAMPITIAGVALLGLGVLGVALPTAVLLGAVIAPTDPVLASDVQAGPPTEDIDEEIEPAEQGGEIRFALTAEAGLNDGLAFPFTNLAIALAAVAVGTSAALVPVDTLAEWLVVDVVYKIGLGAVMGYLVGRLLAYVLFGTPGTTDLARTMEGGEALAATLLAYAATELLNGYGFVAVFVTALVLRHYEWTDQYYRTLHDFAVIVERLLMAAVLVLFGGAIAGGLLAPLSWPAVGIGLAIVLIVRPLAGLLALVGGSGTWDERAVIASFGIRGIGSFFYLSHALSEASFQELELLVEAPRVWALVGFVVLTSIVLHGVTASPVMDQLDRLRRMQRTGLESRQE